MCDAPRLLRNAIDEMGITYEAAAFSLGVEKSTVTRWLAGSTPKLSHALLVEKTYGVPVAAWCDSA